MNIVKNRDVVIGLLLAIVGLIFLVILIPQGIVEPRKVKYAAMSPSFYPRLVAIALVLLGLALSANAYLRGKEAIESDATWRDDAWLRIGIVFGFLALMAFSLGYLGFVLSSAIAIAVLTYLANERRLWLVAVIAVLTPLLLYFFFVKVAKIPIPSGLLEPILVGS